MATQNKNETPKVDVIKLVNDIFTQAIDESASDIHIEPLREGLMIRFRIDGILRVVYEGDRAILEHMAARIKVMSLLELSGIPKPQEGNIKFQHQSGYIDMRVSVFPTSMGEAVVIRILESRKHFGDFTDLGLTSEQVEILDRITKKPHGLVLVTGPTGTGKSTTLMTVLSRLNTTEKSLVTLEDPVERKIEMVRQSNINRDIGLTFAEGLRYMLRQDPDIIMVGEVRDKETARIAVEAAVTGHLVLATIHTNNAAGAIVRLINMGIEPFLLSSALKFVSAQRLARLNCKHCAIQYAPPEELRKMLNAPEDVVFYHGSGCDECNQRGTVGREGIHEVIEVTKSLQELILKRPSDEEVNEVAIQSGMITLREAALQKVYEGKISIEEALRLTE